MAKSSQSPSNRQSPSPERLNGYSSSNNVEPETENNRSFPVKIDANRSEQETLIFRLINRLKRL